MLYAIEFHTSKGFRCFPFIYFILLQVKKKNPSQRMQFDAELKQLFISIVLLFAFVNVLLSFWQTRNNNESTKCIVVLLPWQISKKFLNNCVNAFTEKKTVCDSVSNFFAKKPICFHLARR